MAIPAFRRNLLILKEEWNVGIRPFAEFLGISTSLLQKYLHPRDPISAIDRNIDEYARRLKIPPAQFRGLEVMAVPPPPPNLRTKTSPRADAAKKRYHRK